MCLPVAVIVELIVRRKGDETSPRSRQREEDLGGCVFPHLEEEYIGIGLKKGTGSGKQQKGFDVFCIF